MRSDPVAKNSVRCEINTMLALYDDSASSKPLCPVAGFLQWDRDKSQMLIALIGATGKPGHWHGRLPEPAQIEDMSIEKGSPRAETESAEDERESTPDGQPADDKQAGEQKTGPDNVTFQYHAESQILEIGVQAFPAEADQTPAELARHFFPGLPQRRPNADSILLLRFNAHK